MDPSRQIIPTPDCPDCYVLCSYLPCIPLLPLLPPPPQPPPQSAAPIHIDHRHLHLLASLLLAAALFLLLLSFSAVLLLLLRRRRRRRLLRRSSSFAASGGAASAAAEEEWDGDGDGEVHHVWYIRTVGLDEATIASIAVAEYRSGAGLLGAADCSVCLGEFRDGELVRLLPKCAHAFHVACIDTWLRSHVSCPLCRARIVDPDPAPAGDALPARSAPQLESPQVEARSARVLDGEEGSGVRAEIGVGARDVFDELPAGVLPAGGSESSAGDSDLGESGLQPVRQSVSMDSPFIIVNVADMVDELGADDIGKESLDQEEQSSKDKEKQGNPSKAASTQRGYPEIGRSLSSSSRGFFFSRHGRARSSILPL